MKYLFGSLAKLLNLSLKNAGLSSLIFKLNANVCEKLTFISGLFRLVLLYLLYTV